MRLFFLLPILAILSAPVAAGPLDEATVWSGEGQFRAKLDGPVRKARCRVTTEPVGAGFTLAGKCAAPSGSATLELKVERRDGGVAGALGSSVIDGTIQLAGTETADGIALVSREPLQIDGQSMQFQIALKWPENGLLTLNEWLTPAEGGETTQIVWMSLSR